VHYCIVFFTVRHTEKFHLDHDFEKMNISNNIIKIDRLLQFILATAGQEDFYCRELGPIHLIKYIYLADLEHAELHNGITYTALPWKFHHFGPWSVEAYSRIEPALFEVGAEKKVIESTNPEYDNDFIRWLITDDELYNRLEKQLPLIITTSVQKYVHRFNAVTEDLLHFVYKTRPMLRAKPGDLLDFSIPDYIKKDDKGYSDVIGKFPDELTAKQMKKKKQAIDALKYEFRKKLENRKRKPKLLFSPPPYDDIYVEGLKTLDSLAGEEIKTLKGIVHFTDDIWKSKARFDPDVP
jgi:hypothetical protein